MSERLDLDIVCSECGKELFSNICFTRGGTINIEVGICSNCIERARDKADEEGYGRGLSEGKNADRD